jgi:AraC-like DNA-binding protein
MSVLIRIEDEPRRTRLDHLRHVLGDSIVPFGVWVDPERDVRAEIRAGAVGPVHLIRVSAPPLRADRGPRLIRASDPELLKIDLQLGGPTVFSQGDREGTLYAGDFTLVDLSHPCRFVDREDTHEMLAVKFPRAALPLPHNELERLTAVPISGRAGLGAPITALARHLGRRLEVYGPTEGARLATALMDLLVVALAERLDRVATIAPDTRRRALLAGVQAFIERRLGDPALSPRAIAEAHHISLRYLHKLFEGQDATVSGWIRARRLQRCRRDLLDPAFGDWSVSAIGARWGLTDPTHFGRVFRAAYGLPPAEYRLTASR